MSTHFQEAIPDSHYCLTVHVLQILRNNNNNIGIFPVIVIIMPILLILLA